MRIFTTVLLIACSFFANGQTFSWTGYKHIADGAAITVPITVSGLPTSINDNFGAAHICLNITHSYDADLIVSLQSPAGTSVTLIQGIGGAGNDFQGTCLGMDGVSFTIAQPPYTGLFFPAGEINNFNDGQNPNGIWILTVTDVAAPDTGSLHSASIAFTNNPPLQPGVPGLGAPVGTYLCGTCKCPDNAAGCDLLPDMTASAKEIADYHQEEPGVMFVSNATPNIGYGPLDIYGIDSCFCGGTHVPCNTVCSDGVQLQHVVKQRIYQKVPGKDTLSYYDRFAGKMTFHPQHGHIHVDNWAHYTLRTQTANPDARTWPIIATGTKQSFCLINLGNCADNPGECVDNSGNTILTVPNSNLGWHTGCELNQGIYPGNYDVYSVNLNDPMPLIDICDGPYYIVSETDPDNVFLESDKTNNWIAVPVTLSQQNIAPTISADASTVFCEGGSVTLTASPSNNYLWSTGQTTQSIHVNTAGTFTVSTSCGTATSVSSPVTTTVIPANTVAAVSISIVTGSNPTCPGVFLVFKADAVNGGSVPSYQWKVNGSPVGTNSPSYSTSSLANGQVVTCTLTSNISCLVNPIVVSNSITMVVGAPANPTVSIAQSGGPVAICSGTAVSFTASIPNGTDPVYQWKVNNVNVGTNSNVYSSTTLTNGQQVRCDITALALCPVAKTVGTATTINDYRDDLGAAYPTYYGNGRQQYLLRASEISLGIPGKISALSFSITGVLGDPLTLNGYTIRMANTTLTDVTGAFLSTTLNSFTTVFGPVNFKPVPNSVNRHLFTTPFIWDGSSNIMIDICYSNQVVGNAAYQNYQTATPFLSTTYYEEDGIGGINACSAGGGNTGNMRPNMVFTISQREPASSNTITMNVNPVTNVYTFTGSGNWNVASNWVNNIIPPTPLTGCNEIIIDPPTGQECVLNVPQTVSSGAKITVKLNKKFRIMGNLTIIQ